jgi:hypothetical protein
MRRTDIGLCVAYASLKQVVRDPPKWLGAMSKAGLLYVPPGRDGAKVQDIQLADGKKVDGIVLSRLACSKLGI